MEVLLDYDLSSKCKVWKLTIQESVNFPAASTFSKFRSILWIFSTDSWCSLSDWIFFEYFLNNLWIFSTASWCTHSLTESHHFVKALQLHFEPRRRIPLLCSSIKKNFANPSHLRHQTPLKMTWQIIKWSPFIFRRFQARPKWTNHVVILSLNFITPKNGLSTNDTVVSLPPYNAMMMQMMMIMTRSCRNMIHGGKRKLVEISRDPQGTRWPPAPPHDVDIFSFFVALSSYPLIPLHDNDIFLFVFV